MEVSILTSNNESAKDCSLVTIGTQAAKKVVSEVSSEAGETSFWGMATIRDSKVLVKHWLRMDMRYAPLQCCVDVPRSAQYAQFYCITGD